MHPIQLIPIHHAAVPSDVAAFGVAAAREARAFHRSLEGYAPTPLARLDALAKHLGLRGFLVKDESLRFGLNAFKALGGSYALASLAGDAPRTFVTATDGNHGRGVAWAARRLGQRAVVYLPRGSAEERLRNIRAQGAEAQILDLPYDDCVRFARDRAAANGWTLVQDTSWPGYEDIPRRVMQGYTTMGAELMDQLAGEQPTHVFLQAGVGSMAGAMAGFLADLYGVDRPKVITVEPFAADCVYRTAAANDGGLRFSPPGGSTIMAGLNCGEPCPLAWEVLRDHADFALRMADSVAATGMRVLGSPLPGDARVISGESGAAGVGAAFALMTDPRLRKERDALGLGPESVVLCISTEGDTDREKYRDIVWRGKYGD